MFIIDNPFNNVIQYLFNNGISIEQNRILEILFRGGGGETHLQLVW